MPNIAYHTNYLEVEDHLTKHDYQRLSDLIGDKIGIKLPPGKQMMAEGRLRKRARAVGLDSLDAYCEWLFEGNGLHEELVHLVNALTTNKTDFFREPDHYAQLEQMIVPDLLKRRREHIPLLKVWSAACSTGAEAYSAAMVLEDMARASGLFRYAILGSDVSTEVLVQGRRAIYPADLMEPVPKPMRSRYLMHARRPGTRAEVRIAPELRRQVAFRYLNLMDGTYPVDRDVDVIFLRNVLIYFDKPTQGLVINRLISHLRPGGFLLLGHSESMIGSDYPLTQRATATFQKT